MVPHNNAAWSTKAPSLAWNESRNMRSGLRALRTGVNSHPGCGVRVLAEHTQALVCGLTAFRNRRHYGGAIEEARLKHNEVFFFLVPSHYTGLELQRFSKAALPVVQKSVPLLTFGCLYQRDRDRHKLPVVSRAEITELHLFS